MKAPRVEWHPADADEVILWLTGEIVGEPELDADSSIVITRERLGDALRISAGLDPLGEPTLVYEIGDPPRRSSADRASECAGEAP